jgi:hypothetical protein
MPSADSVTATGVSVLTSTRASLLGAGANPAAHVERDCEQVGRFADSTADGACASGTRSRPWNAIGSRNPLYASSASSTLAYVRSRVVKPSLNQA